MKVSFRLGTLAIAVLMNACNPPHPGDPGIVEGSGGDGDGESHPGGPEQDGSSDAGLPPSDRDAGSGGKQGGQTDTGGTESDGRESTGGSKNDGHAATGGSGSHGDGKAGGAPTNGEAGAAPDDDGDNGAGGSGDPAPSGGSAGLAGSGGSAGLPSSGGSAGLPSSGGSAGLPSSGGSAGLPSSGGSGGLPESAGSGGVGASGGSGGLAENGGTGGTTASGGSAGLAGSGGSGGGDEDHSLDPEYLFTTETFGGNGRTCTTCHTAETGTISPAQVQALYVSDPTNPLFRSVDSDDGASENYAALRERATFRATIALPPGVVLTTDPTATSITLRRSVPTTINSPALDPTIMWDGRAPSLTAQALDAIRGHAQATVTPTAAQLDLIAQFEQGPDFFSSDLLRDYDAGGAAPTWPPGVTDAEQRGRRWFAQDAAAPRFNICGQCHGGPMANETQSNSGLPVGKHFQTVNVSEFNTKGNPTFTFTFPDPKDASKTVTVTTPDPGRALITGDFRDLNFFKIPTLWGVKNTAPYFHDNSAATLEELMDHYERHLATFLRRNVSYPTPHVPTADDKADIIAYLKLL